MVSYVDVLTILLIFFMVAAAKSLEVPKLARKAPVGAPSQPVLERSPRPSLTRAQRRLRELGLDSRMEPRGLVISLSQSLLFASGEDTVSPKALPEIARIAGILGEMRNSVRVIGHADAAPIRNRRFGSNWELSMARSHKILELLSSRYGIPESRLSIVSYGPYRPVAPNDTADGRALNRRVEIVILDDSDSETRQDRRF